MPDRRVGPKSKQDGKTWTFIPAPGYRQPQRKGLHTFIGHVGPVTALRFSPDGNSLASGAQDTSVLLWDLTKLPGGK